MDEQDRLLEIKQRKWEKKERRGEKVRVSHSKDDLRIIIDLDTSRQWRELWDTLKDLKPIKYVKVKCSCGEIYEVPNNYYYRQNALHCDKCHECVSFVNELEVLENFEAFVMDHGKVKL